MITFIFLLAIWVLLCPRLCRPLYERLLFRPNHELGDKTEFQLIVSLYGGQRYNIRNSRGHCLRSFMLGQSTKGSKILFYCMGRDGDIERRTRTLSLLLESGLPVFIFEPAGFGESEGRPTLAGFVEDASAALDFVIQTLGFDIRQIVIYGESLGSLSVAFLLRRAKPAAVIIKSGFTSLERVVKDRIPFMRAYPSWMFYKTTAPLSQILRNAAAPVLIVHGAGDRMVKPVQAREIYEAIEEPKKLIILPESRHGFMSATDERTFARLVTEFVRDVDLPSNLTL